MKRLALCVAVAVLAFFVPVGCRAGTEPNRKEDQELINRLIVILESGLLARIRGLISAMEP